MNLLEQGSTWLDAQRLKMSRTVTYKRASSQVQMPAVIGKTIFRIDTGLGLTERFEARDYIVLARDLVLSGQSVEPAAGDCIVESDGVKTYRYEVLGPGGEPCWRYSDPFRRCLRIHTKLIAVEGA